MFIARSFLPRTHPETRQPSQGNVWMVGGLAPGTAEMDRGLHQSIRSATPARLFTMSVNTTKPSRRDDSHFYHGHIASALKIDRIRRILDFTCCQSAAPAFPTRPIPMLADLEHAP